MKEFKDKLIFARHQRELSQGKLSRLTGIPASTISLFETGNRKPSFDNLRKLANVLNVSTDFLVNETYCNLEEDEILLKHVQKLSKEEKEKLLKFIKIFFE